MQTNNSFSEPMFNTWFLLVIISSFIANGLADQTWQIAVIDILTLLGLLLSIKAKYQYLALKSTRSK